jgi:threonine 3-dehydrogenase
MKTMTAFIKESRNPGFTMVQKPIPSEIKSDEVFIKILATSICGTDVHIYKWDRWSQGRIKPPLTVGHEFSGQVLAIGKDVKNVKVGDIVSAETHIVCGTCEWCKRGEYHICKHTKIIGVDTDGCFAEYAKMPAFNLIVNNSGVIRSSYLFKNLWGMQSTRCFISISRTRRLQWSDVVRLD